MRVLFIEEYLPQEMLGIMWLSRALKDAGHETRALFLPQSGWREQLLEFDPQVVCYSVTTGMHVHLADINRRVKEVLPDVWSVFGGPHPTFSPEYLELDGIDVVCRGEGEGALVELCDRLERGEDPYDVANLSFVRRDTGEIVRNPVRPLVQDLDALGFPDRDLIYDAAPLYRDSHRKVFVSQRGCPMSCSFCFHHAWKKKVYGVNNKQYTRKRSVSHLVAEVQEVRRRYGLEFVHFVDDIFNLRNDWLEEFCERWPREVGLPFDVILMANMTTERHVEALAAAGCVYARIAFEAANDHTRNELFRKNTTRGQLVAASRWIKAHGIRLGALNILGAPGGTLDDELDTIRLNVACGVDHPMASLLQPYPEFDITSTTAQMGYAVSSLDDFPVNFRRTAPLEFENKHQLENLHKLFSLAVRNPWLVRFLPRLIRWRWAYRPYLVLSMLHAELLVAEQARLYARARGLRRLRYAKWVDFAHRLATKGVLRTVQALSKLLGQRDAGRKARVRLQMGDERLVAHVD